MSLAESLERLAKPVPGQDARRTSTVSDLRSGEKSELPRSVGNGSDDSPKSRLSSFTTENLAERDSHKCRTVGSGTPSRKLRTLEEVQKRGRWLGADSVRRHDKSVRVVELGGKVSTGCPNGCFLPEQPLQTSSFWNYCRSPYEMTPKTCLAVTRGYNAFVLCDAGLLVAMEQQQLDVQVLFLRHGSTRTPMLQTRGSQPQVDPTCREEGRECVMRVVV